VYVLRALVITQYRLEQNQMEALVRTFKHDWPQSAIAATSVATFFVLESSSTLVCTGKPFFA